MLKVIYFYIFLSICSSQSIQISVDKNSIDKEETITFSIEASSSQNFPIVDISVLKQAFEIISGPSQMTNIQWVNGKMTSTKTLKWTISPIKTGKIIIPSVEGTLDGAKFKSKPINIFVNVNKKDDNKIFIKAEIDKRKAYLGEQITLTYNLYRNVNASIEPFQIPEFPGFWLEDIYTPQRLNYQTKIINGTSYQVAKLGEKALFPVAYDNHTIPSLKIKANVEIKRKNKRGRDPFFDPFFDSFYTETRTKFLQTDEIEIEIDELPVPIPKDFTGAVGQFNIEAKIDSDTLKVNEGFIYKITLKGTGNIGLFSLPKIKFPNQLEKHEPEKSFEKDIFRNLLTGKRTWEYMLIPRQSGSIKMPSIEMSYFDPINEKWLKLKTDNVYLNIDKNNFEENQNIKKQREDIEFVDRDIFFITEKMENSMKIKKKLNVISIISYLISIILLLTPTIFDKFFGYRLATLNIRRSKKALKISIKLLRSKGVDPFEISSKAFYTYLNHKLNLKTSQLDSSKIKIILDDKIPNIILEKAIELIKLCDSGKYSKVLQKNGDNVLFEMEKLIKSIEKEIK